MLAEFLSWHGDLAQTAEVKELMTESGMCLNSWKAKSGVELGAGLGLPSIVVSNLGTEMVATDGDNSVLHMHIQENTVDLNDLNTFFLTFFSN